MVDRESIESRFTELYDQIGQRLDHLPDELNKTWDEESDDTNEMVQDMLSVLAPQKLWDELGEDFYDMIPEAEPGKFRDLVVRGNLPVTIFSLALHDSVFRDRLRNAITEEICGEDFLSKLEVRSTSTFDKYDEYDKNGPRFDAHFVDRSGMIIRQIVAKVSAYRKTFRAPLSNFFDAKAAELLLRILEEVCARDKDIYEDSAWQTIEDDPEADRDCNLFANLIGSPPTRLRQANFVLDIFVDELPPSAWKHLLGQLESLLGKLREHDAPAHYLHKLADLISRYHAGGRLYEEPEEYEYHLGPAVPGQVPDSPVDQWRHTTPSGMASSSGTTRRPTLSDQPEPQRRRLG